MGYADNDVHASGEVRIELDREEEYSERDKPAGIRQVVGIDLVYNYCGALCDNEFLKKAPCDSYCAVGDA